MAAIDVREPRHNMKPILVLYATREGHTCQIAEHIAEKMQLKGVAAEIVNVAAWQAEFSLMDYGAAVVCASVHKGKHEREMVQFVKHHAAQLGTLPSVFLLVSLSGAGAEDVHADVSKRTQSAADVQKMIDHFLEETGWHPQNIRAVAGALLYSRYPLPVRLILRWISKKSGGPTDMSRDYVFTDWAALDQLIDGLTADWSAGVAAGV